MFKNINSNSGGAKMINIMDYISDLSDADKTEDVDSEKKSVSV